MNSPIRLTQTVKKGGCAAKVAASELRKILASVNFPPAPPELTIDGRDFDDAAVYRLSADQAMVQTIDFFTPILDSPFEFGRVAAANAISDIYAMGARPVMALAVLAFPVADLPADVVTEVMRGACETLGRAKCALAGGHSIDDDTLKFGLSVTGLVHPEKVWANSGARVGDVLILTKALGTGTLTAALKREAVSEDDIRVAIESMAQLNNAVETLDATIHRGHSLTSSVHAATDITGFGLSGHSMQMAKASGVKLTLNASALPKLPRAQEWLAREFLTKAHRTNREYTAASLTISPTVDRLDELLIHDPQTSGGLLLSVDEDAAPLVLSALRAQFPFAAEIGRVVSGSAGTLELN